MRRLSLRRTLTFMAATVLAAAGLVGPVARPAFAADLCTGTAGVNLMPGAHLTDVRTIHITQQGTQAGTLLCTVDPLLGTLLAKTVDIHVSGTCVGTEVDSAQTSTIVVRFPNESTDSTINVTGAVLGVTSASKVITFSGTVQPGDPRAGQNLQMVITSVGPTTQCATTPGLTSFTGVATLVFI
jgi:hypothetical protein